MVMLATSPKVRVEERIRKHKDEGIRLGRVILPMKVVISDQSYKSVTEEQVQQAFLAEMKAHGFHSMVTMIDYEPQEKSLVEQLNVTYDIVIVDVWYYFNIVPALFGQ